MPQYNGVWTLEAQAQAQSNQQWVTDPNFKNTTLLLQADGAANGAQNNLFLDTSSNQFAITRNGNTTQGSFSPFSQAPGYWGNYFNGSSDYLTLTSGVTFGTSDYTLEFFAYKTTSWTDGFDFLDAATSGLALYVSSGTIAVTKQNTGGAAVVLGSLTSLSPNAWYHFAIVRSSGSVRCYVNGSPLQAAVSDANNYTVATTKICGTSDGYFDGYISNMRLATSALYSIAGSSITVPTAPLATATGVQYLGSQSNRFVDTTGTQTVAVGGGTPSVQAFGPFAPALQWTPDVVGGSGYFDGTGDFLQLADSTAWDLTGDYTIEMWLYSTATPVSTTFFQLGSSSNFLVIYLASATKYITTTGSLSITASTALALNSWNHMALVRSGSGTNNTVLYLNGVNVGQATNTTSFTGSASNGVRIGAEYPSNYYFNGYIAGNRIVNGTAVYTAAFTPPTAPPTAITNTSLLANYTNAGIYDGKMNTSWETVNSAQVSTNPVKYGSGSIYFNGVASQRLLPSQLYPQLTPGTGDFTIECWLYVVGKAATAASAIIDYRPGVNGTYINWVVDFGGYGVGSTTAPKLMLYADSAVFITGDVISMGQWNHVALCRANGITRMFINGVLACTPTADTKNYASGGSAANYRPCIGATDGGDSLFGYIDDFRISRFARYIANFTPPQQALPRQ